jgi:CubicO group peptidase (beta-lactamase class C family)
MGQQNNGQRDMTQVEQLMQQALSAKVFPGAVLLVSQSSRVTFFEAYGYTNLFTQAPMAKETVFDLASLTKPLATTLSIIKLIQDQRLDLEHELGFLLPQFRNSDKSKVKLKHLLYHNSGLPDYRPYYQDLMRFPQGDRSEALRVLLVKEPLIHVTGETAVYSDLGFMILAWVIETISGQRLDRFVGEQVYAPLGLDKLFFVDLNSSAALTGFAATERCPWRGFLLEGQVHDDNAYAVGGIDGHAGLFGTAADIHSLLSELLTANCDPDAVTHFPHALVRKFFKPLSGSDRTLGFDTPSRTESSCGAYFSANSVGHLGYTGTSFWLDLDQSIIVVLLTNRVHPTRDNETIKTFRPQLHDAVMQSLLGSEVQDL